MIVSLRGTHGSGKSTAVRRFLSRYPGYESIPGKKHPEGYRVTISELSKPLYIVGHYETPCGGCDSIQPYSLIWPRVVSYAEKGHVLFEGALVSSSYGNIGRASEVYGDEVVFAFMDTPLEKCIERIKKRREQSGKSYTKPFNPANTISKAKNVTRSIEVITKIGRRVVIVNHKKATNIILRLFKEFDNVEN